MKLPVLVDEVAGQGHERLTRARGPHVSSEAHGCEVTFHSCNYFMNMFSDFIGFDFDKPGVGSSVLQLNFSVCNLHKFNERFLSNNFESSPSVCKKVNNGVINSSI